MSEADESCQMGLKWITLYSREGGRDRAAPYRSRVRMIAPDIERDQLARDSTQAHQDRVILAD